MRRWNWADTILRRLAAPPGRATPRVGEDIPLRSLFEARCLSKSWCKVIVTYDLLL